MKCVLTADIYEYRKGDVIDVPPSDPRGLVGSGVAVKVKKEAKKKKGARDGNDS